MTLFLIGCVSVKIDEIEKSEDAKTEEVEDIIEEVEEPPRISYKLYNEIEGLMFIKPLEKSYINLVDTKVDEKKAKDYMTDDGVMMAHRIEYDITSNKEIEIYIVPSYDQFELIQQGDDSFKYYDECSGLKSECYVSFYSGMVIINKENSSAKIERNIKIFEPVVNETSLE